MLVNFCERSVRKGRPSWSYNRQIAWTYVTDSCCPLDTATQLILKQRTVTHMSRLLVHGFLLEIECRIYSDKLREAVRWVSDVKLHLFHKCIIISLQDQALPYHALVEGSSVDQLCSNGISVFVSRCAVEHLIFDQREIIMWSIAWVPIERGSLVVSQH